MLPDGQVLPGRSIAKFVAGDRGADGLERRIAALGASPRSAEADRRAWLRTALEQIGARRQRHPGTHRFCGRFSRVAAWLMTPPGREKKVLETSCAHSAPPRTCSFGTWQ
ncbi:hypothetical protein ACWEEL_39940, partial [Streptomyces sp. NPDC005009]